MDNLDRSIDLWSSDDTGGKLVWSAGTSNARFYFYIPKWRVPEPWPALVHVHITDNLTEWEKYEPLTPTVAQKKAELLERPILAKIGYSELHKETFRYDPFGVQEVEIGSPYIPMFLLPFEPPKVLLVRVQWKRNIKSKFRITRIPRHSKRL
jgi:hypothetical protein